MLAVVARALACFSVTALPALLTVAAFVYLGRGAGLVSAGIVAFGWTLGALHSDMREQRRNRPYNAASSIRKAA